MAIEVQDSLEYLFLFVNLRVSNTRQRSRQRLAYMIGQIMILQSSVPQPCGKDNQIGEKVARAEGLRVDVDGAKDAGVRDASKEGRVEGNDLVVDGTDDSHLDARGEDDAEARRRDKSA